jgi:hypothetical protein
MAFPVAVHEEVRDLGAKLSKFGVLLSALVSLFFQGVLILMLHHREVKGADVRQFFRRVLGTRRSSRCRSPRRSGASIFFSIKLVLEKLVRGLTRISQSRTHTGLPG